MTTVRLRIATQVASRIVEAAQAAGASQLVLVAPSGAGGGGGLFGGFLGGGGSSSAVEQASDHADLLWSSLWCGKVAERLPGGNRPSCSSHVAGWRL